MSENGRTRDRCGGRLAIAAIVSVVAGLACAIIGFDARAGLAHSASEGLQAFGLVFGSVWVSAVSPGCRRRPRCLFGDRERPSVLSHEGARHE